MAGRGRRIASSTEKDMACTKLEDGVINSPEINIKLLIEKINEISPTNIDPVVMTETGNLFKQLLVDQESAKNVLSNLHCKALSDSNFGEKFVIAFSQLSSQPINNISLRSELLSFIENDFKIKETMFQSDINKFMNAVMLLGSVYNVIKVCGVPLSVLGKPMLEYMVMLLGGGEEQLRVLAIQILLNGEKILNTENLEKSYELLKHSLRTTIIERELTSKPKCWIMLAIDIMSNNFKPPTGVLRDFYLENLGDEYLQLESMAKHSNSSISNETPEKNQVSKTINSEEIFQDIQNLGIQQGSRGLRTSNKSESNNFNLRNKKNSDAKTRENNQKSPQNKAQTVAPDNNDDDDDDEFYGIQIQKEKITKKPKSTQKQNQASN